MSRVLTQEMGVVILHNLRMRIRNRQATSGEGGAVFLMLTEMEMDALDVALGEWEEIALAVVAKDEAAEIAQHFPTVDPPPAPKPPKPSRSKRADKGFREPKGY